MTDAAPPESTEASPTPDGAAGAPPVDLLDRPGDDAVPGRGSSDDRFSGRRTVAVAAAVGAVAAAYFLAWEVLFVIALAFASVLLAVFFRTGGWAVGRAIGVRTGGGMVVFVIALLAGTVTAAMMFAPTVAGQVQDLTEQLPAARDRARQLVGQYQWAQSALDELGSGGSAEIQALARRAGGYFFSLIGTLSTAVIVAFTALYLAADPGLYTRGALHLVPPRHRDRAGHTMERVGYALRWWILGQLASMSTVGLLTLVGLLVLGVPLAFLCALLTMLLTFIPNIGPVLSVIPPTLLALSVDASTGGWFGGGTTLALWVLGLYLCVQLLESYLITPLIQKRAVALPPALLILFQILVATLLGAIGLALAAPLLAALLVAVSELYVKPVLHDPTPNISDRMNGAGGGG